MKLLFRKSYTIGFILLLSFSALFYSCKKETFITFEGRLLISNTNPLQVTNYKLYFFQSVSTGIPIAIYSTSSEGFTTTDNNGNYSMKFETGKSGFLVFQRANTGSVNLTGEPSGNFSGFIISNIPANGGTIYLHKKISNATLM